MTSEDGKLFASPVMFGERVDLRAGGFLTAPKDGVLVEMAIGAGSAYVLLDPGQAIAHANAVARATGAVYRAQIDDTGTRTPLRTVLARLAGLGRR